MWSTCEGVVCGGIKVLHTHVHLAAPLCPGYVPEVGANQHQCRIAVGKSPDYPRASANLPVKALNDIVGADAYPVLIREIHVG